MQSAGQSAPQVTGQPNWRKGDKVSGNPRGSESKAVRLAKLDAKCREIAEALGGWASMSALDKTQIEQAAKLLLRPWPRSAEDQVRVVNAAQRLIAACELRRGRAPQLRRPARQVHELVDGMIRDDRQA
jgi:hypothetical protein